MMKNKSSKQIIGEESNDMNMNNRASDQMNDQTLKMNNELLVSQQKD